MKVLNTKKKRKTDSSSALNSFEEGYVDTKETTQGDSSHDS